MQISKEALEFVNENIDKLLSDVNLTDDTKRVIRLRYGMDSGEPMGFKEIRKTLRWPIAKMKRELTRAEKTVFNFIKIRL